QSVFFGPLVPSLPWDKRMPRSAACEAGLKVGKGRPKEETPRSSRRVKAGPGSGTTPVWGGDTGALWGTCGGCGGGKQQGPSPPLVVSKGVGDYRTQLKNQQKFRRSADDFSLFPSLSRPATAAQTMGWNVGRSAS